MTGPDLEGLLEAGAVVYEVKAPEDIPWVDWRTGLQLNAEGVTLQNEFNTSWIMRHHPDLKGRVSLEHQLLLLGKIFRRAV